MQITKYNTPLLPNLPDYAHNVGNHVKKREILMKAVSEKD